MSQIIDLLKRIKNTEIDKVQEKLAETYLFSTSDESTPYVFKTKKRFILIISWLSIVILLLCAVLLYMFFTHTFYEDLLLTQKVSFSGAIANESRSVRGYITLINNGAKKDAVVSINLKRPLDLSNKYLLINIMARKGGGRLKVIFRDKNYRSYLSNTLDIVDTKRDWQNFIIFAKGPKQSIDTRNIRHIRLEFEDSPLQDKVGSIIYIKKVILIDK